MHKKPSKLGAGDFALILSKSLVEQQGVVHLENLVYSLTTVGPYYFDSEVILGRATHGMKRDDVVAAMWRERSLARAEQAPSAHF